MRGITRKSAKRTILRRRQGGCCYWCGIAMTHRKSRVPSAETFDHVVPKAHGGRNVFQNLVLACFACNNARGSLAAEAFRILVENRKRLGIPL